MAVNIFWPPIAILSMFVLVVAFLILKYGDKVCKNIHLPKPQNYEIEGQSSDNETYLTDEKGSIREFIEIPQMEMEVSEKKEAYEYAL